MINRLQLQVIYKELHLKDIIKEVLKVVLKVVHQVDHE